jgi:hypothetical protein
VKELWAVGKPNREELGKLLYEEREERCSVGGAGNREGFHQWLKDAGIPKQSAYRRIAEHEILIGERAPENAYDQSIPEPVPSGTPAVAPIAEPWTRADEKRKSRSEPLADINELQALARRLIDAGFKTLLEAGEDRSHLWSAKEWLKGKF